MRKLLRRITFSSAPDLWDLVPVALVLPLVATGFYFFHRLRELEWNLQKLDASVPERTEQLLRHELGTIAYLALFGSLLVCVGAWIVVRVVRDARRREQDAKQALAESEARLLEAERVARIGYWRWDAVTDSIFLSPQAGALLGREAGDQHVSLLEMTGMHVLEDQRNFVDRISYVMDTGNTSQSDVCIPTLRGDRWAHSIIRPARDAQKNIVGVFGTLQDITARKRIEEELRALKADYATLLDHLPAVVLYMDREGRCMMVNQAAVEFSGVPREKYVGRHFRDINPHGADQRLADNDEVIRTGVPKLGMIEEITLLNGLKRWVQTDKIPRRDANGRVIGVVVFALDVTERKLAEEQIAHLACYDSLTDLCNRRVLTERLTHTLATCERRRWQCALLFIDLDRFKEINDSHGHDIGDEVLKKVAHRLQECVRSEDTVARLGGDEFVVLLSQIKQISDAMAVASKLSEALAQPIAVGEVTVTAGSSIGVAVYPEHGSTRHELMRAADKAMYQAKSSGSGEVRLASVAAAA